MSWQARSRIVVLLLLLGGFRAQAQDFTVPMVTTQRPVGVPNATFERKPFDVPPTLNAEGDLVYAADISGTGVNDDFGIWRVTDTTTTLIATRSFTTRLGAMIASPDHLSIDHKQRVSFYATLGAGNNADAAIIEFADALVDDYGIVLVEGEEIGGPGRVLFDIKRPYAVSSRGEYSVAVQLGNGSTSVEEYQILQGREGTFLPIVRTGDDLVGTTDTVSRITLEAADDQGRVVFTTGDHLVLSITPSQRVVIKTYEPGSLSRMRFEVKFSQDGAVLVDELNTSTGDNALIVYRNRQITTIVRKGDVLSGRGGTRTVATILQHFFSSNGTVVYAIRDQDSKVSFWHHYDGGDSLLLMEGDKTDVPEQVTLLRLGNLFASDQAGTVAFTATESGFSFGLHYLNVRTGLVRAFMREGTAVPVGNGETLRTTTVTQWPNENVGLYAGYFRLLQSTGWLVLQPTLESSHQAIILTNLYRQFIVNSVGDGADADPGDGICSTGTMINGVPECTLRAALMEANTSTSQHLIRFKPENGDVIEPQSPLPPVAATVMMDGDYSTSDTGYNQLNMIRIHGGGGSSLSNSGLVITDAGSGSVLRNLQITGYRRAGVEVDRAANVRMVNLYLGWPYNVGPASIRRMDRGILLSNAQGTLIESADHLVWIEDEENGGYDFRYINGTSISHCGIGVEVVGTESTRNHIRSAVIGDEHDRLFEEAEYRTVDHGIVVRDGAHDNVIGSGEGEEVNFTTMTATVNNYLVTGISVLGATTRNTVIRSARIGGHLSSHELQAQVYGGRIGILLNGSRNTRIGSAASPSYVMSNRVGIVVTGGDSVLTHLIGTVIGDPSVSPHPAIQVAGVYVTSSSHNTIGAFAEEIVVGPAVTNTFRENQQAVVISGASATGNRVQGLEVDNEALTGVGIRVIGAKGTRIGAVSDPVVIRRVGTGIRCESAPQTQVTGVRISSSTSSLIPVGIDIQHSPDCRIDDDQNAPLVDSTLRMLANVIEKCNVGIRVFGEGSRNTVISDADVGSVKNGNDTGIAVIDAYGTRIGSSPRTNGTGCYIVGNRVGILVQNSDASARKGRTVIESNAIIGNEIGIVLDRPVQAVVANNTIADQSKTQSSGSGTGVLVEYQGSVRLLNNTVWGNRGDQSGIHLNGGRSDILGNLVAQDAGTGVFIGADATAVIHATSIVDNAGPGMRSEASAVQDATGNWWGHASGPSGDGPGTGDDVLGNIDYSDWLTVPDTKHAYPYWDTVWVAAGDTATALVGFIDHANAEYGATASIVDDAGWYYGETPIQADSLDSLGWVIAVPIAPGSTPSASESVVTVSVTPDGQPAETTSFLAIQYLAEPTDLSVVPDTVWLDAGAQTMFTASLTDQHGASIASGPVWGASDGVIADGLFTAPLTAGVYTITASEGGLSGTAIAIVDATTGLAQQTPIEDRGVVIYPNPAQERLVVETPTNGPSLVTLELISVKGECVLRRSVNTHGKRASFEIDLVTTGIAPGSYQVVVTIGDRRESHGLVITR